VVFLKNFLGKHVVTVFVFTAISTVIFDTNCLTFKFFKKIACIKHKRKKSRHLFCSTQDNFYEVEKNTFYRSKQLTHKKLRYYIKKFGIKTIINLRGENTHRKWWRREKMVTEEFGVKFYNIPMSAYRNPKKRQISFLIDLYKTSKMAPRPILVHCHGGADRTGEAAALWVLTQQKRSKSIALKQLSLKYGYIKWRAPLKRQFIKTFTL